MKHLTALVELYDWNPGTKVFERKWAGVDYKVTNVPEPPRGFFRRIHPVTVHNKRVRCKPCLGEVAFRASDRSKSRLEKGLP